MPLYPQYSAATSATVVRRGVPSSLGRHARAANAAGERRLTTTSPSYIEALAVSINAHLATLPFKPELIVASFHGMPQKYVDKGDPYQAQCVATADALAQAHGA